MSAEGIIEKIRRQSQERVREIARNGREEADRRHEEILDRAQQDVREMTERAEAEARESFETSRLSATLEMRKNSLASKRSMLDKAFEKALQKMRSATPEVRAEYYGKIVAENVPEEGAVLVANERDAQLVSRCLPQWERELRERYDSFGGLILSERQGNFAGGLMIECGKYDIDATFERTLQDVREDYEIEVSQSLFDTEE